MNETTVNIRVSNTLATSVEVSLFDVTCLVLVTFYFQDLPLLEKCTLIPPKLTCKLNLSMVPFLPGLAFVKQPFGINVHTFAFHIGYPMNVWC